MTHMRGIVNGVSGRAFPGAAACGLLLSVAVALTYLSGCGKESEPVEELVRPVRYDPVYATGGTRVRTFSGTARAGLESQLSFKVAGTIERVAVNVGDSVGKGGLIAVLDEKDYRLRLEEAEASLTQAKAQARNAQNSYERVQALYENSNASKQDLDAARAAYESATAQVESIERRLELAQAQVSYCRLVAPFDGAVAAVAVEESENVTAGKPVATLSAQGRPEVQVAVPEVLIAQIETGSEVSVAFDAIPDREYRATVTEVGVASTGFATTFPVTVRLDRNAPDVRPGMAAEVSFALATEGPAERIIVPAVAVGEDRQGRFVFTVEPTDGGLGVAHRVAVTVGELTSDGLEILSGLQEGDLVITAGVSRIVDGQRVKLL
jgi:RND family efflux transporter MFP subunit